MSNKAFSRIRRIVTGERGKDGGEPLLESGVTKLEKFVHFWVLVWRSFVRNRCPVRASALSFSTLLALIPMLAVVMSITSSLMKSQGEDKIYDLVDRVLASVMPPAVREDGSPATEDIFGEDTTTASTTNLNPAAATTGDATNAAAAVHLTTAAANAVVEQRVVSAQKEVARRIRDFIQNTRSGTLGVIGMIALVFVAIIMLSRIEETFNDIWGVKRGRNWLYRIVLYWTVISLGPVLLVGAITLSGGSHLQSARAIITEMPFVGELIFKWLPLVVLCLTFALLYMVVPNTKVNFSAGLIGGVAAGMLLHLNHVFGFVYVSRVVTNYKIYGSLGLVPVFMAGLYLSWLILLLGAQLAYAFQNRLVYLQEKIAENVNQRGREFVALRLMTCIGQRFQRGEAPATIQGMSLELGVPSRLVQQVLQTLLAAHLVVEVSGQEPGYSPGRPLENINAHHILMAMRAASGRELVTRDEPVRAEVYGEFARIQEAERAAASTVSLLALVNRATARLELASPAAELIVTGLPPVGESAVSAGGGGATEVASAKISSASPGSGTPPSTSGATPETIAPPGIQSPTASSNDNESFPL